MFRRTSGMGILVAVLAGCVMQSRCGMCSGGVTPAKDDVQSGQLPLKAANPHLYALGAGFGVGSLSEMQSVMNLPLVVRTYRCKLTLSNCDVKPKSLAIAPQMEVWLEPGLKSWPEFAVGQVKGVVSVAFTVDTGSGTALFIERCSVPQAGALSSDKPVILENRRRVLPRVQSETFSFVESSEGSGSLGVVGNGEDGIWLGTPGAGDDQAKWRLTTFYGKSGVCPKGIRVDKETLLIFAIEGGSGGSVKVLQCKMERTDWVLSSERLLKQMPAQRLAIRERASKLFLLIGKQTGAGHQVQLFCSADKGETWSIVGFAAIEKRGTLIDLALSADCTRAGAIVRDATNQDEGDTIVQVLLLLPQKDSIVEKGDKVSVTSDGHGPANAK